MNNFKVCDFKIGDWVRDSRNNLVGRIDEDHRLSHTTEKYKGNLDSFLELWEPKAGEWCFCTWNKENIILAQFNCMDDGHYLCTVLNGIKRRFNMCEPFINELPSWVKDSR
jgi:hypothetical protein